MQPGIHQQLLDKVRKYKIPQRAVGLLSSSPPLILAGPTGSGKNAIAEYLEEGRGYKRVVTHTTRQPRDDEIDSQHYHFVNEEEMAKLIDSQAMIEVKTVHGETVYGTSIDAYESVVNSGAKPILTIDIQGIREIIKELPKLRPVFILPPSFEVWMGRLSGRGAMSHIDRQRRLRSAQTELKEAMDDEHFVLTINHDVPEAANEIVRGATDNSKRLHACELIQTLLEDIRVY